jgi:hypothetical protein
LPDRRLFNPASYLWDVNGIPSSQIFTIKTDSQFERTALEIFQYQAFECVIYSEFIKGLGIHPHSIHNISEIPFLPIQFFKDHPVICGTKKPAITFSSSATGGIQSQHHVTDLSLYEKSFREGFKAFYGDIKEYAVLALLPSYLERDGSSLVYMVDDLIRESGNPESGYFLYNHDELCHVLQKLKGKSTPAILIGVTYALLDFTEQYRIDFPELIIMETGGMKGKRKELIREELHTILCEGFGVSVIHSEYGMTELLSQAYSKGEGIFKCPAWMRVTVRDINDPLSLMAPGQTGGINVIDLANMNSCSFIATQDLGRLSENGNFEVLGRFDNSDIRGCNLMVQ